MLREIVKNIFCSTVLRPPCCPCLAISGQCAPWPTPSTTSPLMALNLCRAGDKGRPCRRVPDDRLPRGRQRRKAVNFGLPCYRQWQPEDCQSSTVANAALYASSHSSLRRPQDLRPHRGCRRSVVRGKRRRDLRSDRSKRRGKDHHDGVHRRAAQARPRHHLGSGPRSLSRRSTSCRSASAFNCSRRSCRSESKSGRRSTSGHRSTGRKPSMANGCSNSSVSPTSATPGS